MGHNVNVDRKHAPPSPMIALTLGEMRAAGWTVRAVCQKCRVSLRVSLDQMIREMGPSEIIWGRRPPCRVDGCEGRVVFSVQAVPRGTLVPMAKPPGDAAITAYAERLKRRYRPLADRKPDDMF